MIERYVNTCTNNEFDEEKANGKERIQERIEKRE